MNDRVSGDCIAARQHLSQNLHAMNIEDEEVEREEFQPKVVGRGLVAQFENPEDQQWHLADSEHPYAPFPGNALKWESFVYEDGTSFEGLARENIPHGKGVMIFGTGTGAGIQLVEPGDKYEGEFFAGFANGLGSYTSASGEVYRGEWLYGKRHGCGAATSFTPYFRELRKGSTPEDAWRKTKSTILSKRMRYGSWDRNRFVRDAADNNDEACTVSDVRGLLQEMESVVTKARMFQHKPDGDATHLNLRDQNGVPIPVFQDPLHYPHGTKFLAPGPLGQCHPIPDNERLKSEMRKHARNYLRIYNQYNLPYLAKPGDDLFAAARLHQIQQLQLEHFNRIAAGEDEETVLKELDERLQSSQLARPGPVSDRRSKQGTKGQHPKAAQSTSTVKLQDREGVDDSDLVASASDAVGGHRVPPSVFCSVSGSSERATRVVSTALGRVSSSLMPRVLRRRPIGRK